MSKNQRPVVFIASSGFAPESQLLADVLQATGLEQDLVVGTFRGDPAVLLPEDIDIQDVAYELCTYGHDLLIINSSRSVSLLDEDGDPCEYLGQLRDTTEHGDMQFPHGNFRLI